MTIDKKTGQPTEFAKWIFSTMSEALKKYYPHIWKGMTEQRLNVFARKICPENIIETLRLAIVPICDDNEYMKSNLCNLHVDRKNDRKLSEVAIFSHMVYTNEEKTCGHRVSIIMYTRHSIFTFMNREVRNYENKNGGDHIKKLIQCMAEVRETEPHRFHPSKLAEHLRCREPTGKMMCDWNYYDFNCHMDPFIFASPIVGAMAYLNFKFKLSYGENLSILRCYMLMPNTTHYFATVALSYIKKGQLPARQLELGRVMYLHAMELYLSRSGPVISYRFANYNPLIIPTKHEWIQNVTEMSAFALESFLEVEKAKSEEEIEAIYKKVIDGWTQKSIAGVKYLGGNHALGIAALLGVVPYEFSKMYFTRQTTKGLEYFGQTAATAPSFFKGIRDEIQKQLGEYVTIKITENYSCKGVRILKPREMKPKLAAVARKREETFKDHHIEVLPIIYTDGKTKTIIEYLDGEKNEIEGPIFPKWDYLGKMVSPYEFTKADGIQSLLLYRKSRKTKMLYMLDYMLIVEPYAYEECYQENMKAFK